MASTRPFCEILVSLKQSYLKTNKFFLFFLEKLCISCLWYPLIVYNSSRATCLLKKDRDYILLNLAHNIVQEVDQSQHWPWLLSFQKKINLKSQQTTINSVKAIKRYVFLVNMQLASIFALYFYEGPSIFSSFSFVYANWLFILLESLYYFEKETIWITDM